MMKTKSKGKVYDAYLLNSWESNHLIDDTLLSLGCNILLRGFAEDYYNLVVFVPNQEGLNYLQENAAFFCQFPASNDDLRRIYELMNSDKKEGQALNLSSTKEINKEVSYDLL